jgi:hypothetical protein
MKGGSSARVARLFFMFFVQDSLQSAQQKSLF